MTTTEPVTSRSSGTGDSTVDFASLPRPPLVRGVPMVGSWQMLRDPSSFVDACYKAHGPVFRIKLMGGEKIVIAGREGAELFASSDPDTWSRKLIFERVTDDLGTEDFIPALDGDVREHYRRLMQLGFSREIVGRYQDELFGLTVRAVQSWDIGRELEAVPMLGDLAAAQIGLVTGNCELTDIAEDIELALLPMFGIPLGLLPKMTLSLPNYKRAKVRIHKRFVEALEQHRKVKPGRHRKADVIDLLLQSEDADGKGLSDLIVFVTTLFGWASGQIYLARHYAFLLYSLMKRPDVLDRILDEVEAVWANGPPSLQDLRRMTALRHASLECLRHFPIQAVMPFRITKSFAFAGHRIEKGDLVYFVPMTAHFSPEIYASPTKFDIDRFAEPRSEHRMRHAFTTYGVHPRNCVATGMVEMMTLVTFSTIFRHRSFSFPRPYQLKVVLRPVPSPDRHFRVRVGQAQAHEIDADVFQTIMSRPDDVPLFEPLDTAAVETMVATTTVERFAAGEIVIREGDAAESFYTIVSGRAEVVKAGDDGTEQVVATLGAGDSFGEIGLIENCPRTATVRAAGDSGLSVIVLAGETFREMVASGDLMADEIAEIVRKRTAATNLATALPSLSPESLAQVLGSYETVEYAAGDVVIRQGDEARWFYIINKGRMEVVNHHPKGGDIVLGKLGPGQYFGELGLLRDVPRTATVRVLEGPAEVLRVGREAFLALWGDESETRKALGPEISRRLVELAEQGEPGDDTPAD